MKVRTRLHLLAWVVAAGVLLAGCGDSPVTEEKIAEAWESISVTILSPEAGAAYNEPNHPHLVFTATAGPNDSAIPSNFLEATVYDGTEGSLTNPQPLDTVESGAALPAVQDGRHLLEFVVLSPAGGAQHTTRVGFTTDNVAPEVTITSPVADTNDPTPLLSFSVSADVDDGGVSVVVDGVLFAPDAEGALVAEEGGQQLTTVDGGYELYPLGDGPHTIQVLAVDRARNLGMDTTTFTVDATAPGIGIDAPVDGSTVNTVPDLVLTADEAGTLRVNVNGAGWSDAGSVSAGVQTTVALSGITEGPNTVAAAVTDWLGNVGSAQVSFTFDASAPSVSVTDPSGAFPLEGEVTRGMVPDDLTPYSVPFAYSTSDDGTIVDVAAALDVQDGEGNWVPAGSLDPAATAISLTAGGTYRVTVSATDDASNTGTGASQFTLDLAVPQVAVTAPAHGAKVGTTSPTLEVWSDEQSEEDVRVYVFPGEFVADYYNLHDVAPVQPGDGLLYSDGQPLDEGTNTVVVEIEDDAGWIGMDYSTFTVDADGPFVEIIHPEDGDTFARRNFPLKYNAHNATSVHILVTDGLGNVLVDQTRMIDPVEPIPRTYEESLSFSTDGTYTATLTASAPDWADVTDAVTFTVETEKPAVEILSPGEGNDVFTGDVPVRFRAYNALGATIKVDGHQRAQIALGNDPAGELVELTLSGESEGPHTLRVDVDGEFGSAFDTAGFAVDTTAPVVTVASPVDGETYYSDQVSLVYDVDEDNGPTADTATVVDVDTLDTWTQAVVSGSVIGPLADGTYELTVSATDVVGHTGTSAPVTFTVDAEEDPAGDPIGPPRSERNAACLLNVEPGYDLGMCLKELNDPQ